MADLPVLLIAAGRSGRLGQPKQLLSWENKTLIEHQIQKLLNTGKPVTVVLGAYAEIIIPVIANYPVDISVNESWERGMGSSISCGIKDLHKKNHGANGVLISLVDQPLVPLSHIKKILKLFQPGKQQIVASKSPSGWLGVPAVFDKNYFEPLKNLNEKEGARNLIRNSKNPVLKIECAEMMDDIDTMESYRKILKKFENT